MIHLTDKTIVISGMKSIMFLAVLCVPMPILAVRALAVTWVILFIWMVIRIIRVDTRVIDHI